jgi:hypothetical protein
MKHSKHRVRTHKWINGVLEVLDDWFETFEDAMDHATKSGAQSAKIYNPDGDLVHSGTIAENSYA